MSVVDTVLKEINNLDLQEGDRLPSERRLADSCAISRSSVRNALKELQSKRVLAVRQGSGYFLSSSFALRQALIGQDAAWSMERIRQVFAARSYVAAHVTVLGSKNISPERLGELEDCLVELGKAIINMEIQAIDPLHQRFMNIIQESCPNREFIRMLNEVRIPAHFTISVLQMADMDERNGLFSEHVNLFQAVKKAEHDKTGEICRRISNRNLGLFEKYARHIEF